MQKVTHIHSLRERDELRVTRIGLPYVRVYLVMTVLRPCQGVRVEFDEYEFCPGFIKMFKYITFMHAKIAKCYLNIPGFNNYPDHDLDDIVFIQRVLFYFCHAFLGKVISRTVVKPEGLRVGGDNNPIQTISF